MSKPLNIAILIFDDVEVLDFAGPFEVFSVANRDIEPPPLPSPRLSWHAED